MNELAGTFQAAFGPCGDPWPSTLHYPVYSMPQTDLVRRFEKLVLERADWERRCHEAQSEVEALKKRLTAAGIKA